VVIITTKSAKPGRTVVSYNGFYGIKKLPSTLDVLSPYEFVMWEYERTRIGIWTTAGTTDSTNFAKRYGTTWDTLSVYKNVPVENWQKDIMGQTGITQTHNLSLGGGNKNTQYYLSYSYNDEKAILLNSAYRRNLVSFKLDHKLTNKLKLNLTTRYTDQAVYGAGISSTQGSSYNRLRNAVKYRPFLSPGLDAGTIDPSLVDPSVGNGLSLVNPIALNNAEYRKNKPMQVI